MLKIVREVAGNLKPDGTCKLEGSRSVSEYLRKNKVKSLVA